MSITQVLISTTQVVISLTQAVILLLLCNASIKYFITGFAVIIHFIIFISLEPPSISDIFVKDISTTQDGATVYQLYCRYKTDANLMIDITWSLDENTCSNSVILNKTERPELANVTVSQATSVQSECAVMCIGQSERKKSCREITLNQSERSVSKDSCLFSSQSVRLPVHSM